MDLPKKHHMSLSFEYLIPEEPVITKDNPSGRRVFGPQALSLFDGLTVKVNLDRIRFDFNRETLTINSGHDLPDRGIVFVDLEWQVQRASSPRMWRVLRAEVTVVDIIGGEIAFCGSHVTRGDSSIPNHLDKVVSELNRAVADTMSRK